MTALQFQVGETYEDGIIYVVDTIPITISTGGGEDIDFPYTTIVNLDPFTVDGTTYYSQTFSLDGARATEILGGKPEDLPDLGGLWDFTNGLYNETTLQIAYRKVYDPQEAIILETQEDYEALFPIDWDDKKTTKYFIAEKQQYQGNQSYYNLFNVPASSANDPKTAFGPEHGQYYTKPIYELKQEYQTNLIFWIDETKHFGYSQFWTVESSGNRYFVNSHSRLFGNAAPYIGGTLDFDEHFLAGIDDPDNGPQNFNGSPNEFTAAGYAVGAVMEPTSEPLPTTSSHTRSVIFEYDYNGNKYYGLAVISYARDPEAPQGEEESIYDCRVFGISENFFNAAEQPPTPEEEDNNEEPGGNGRRPPTINQGPGALMGLNFDLGLSSVNPLSRGLKLSYMPMTNLNAYIDEYITLKTGDIPTSGLTPDLQLLVAPATEAIMQNCYDTILDVYRLPYTPRGTYAGGFNIGGTVLEHGGPVLYGFAQKQTIEMGLLNLPEIFGSYLDYAPNITAQIWLPFCGMYQIPINAFMGGQLRLQYVVDLLSGSCTAYLFGTDRHGHQTLIGSFGGDMKLPVPLGITAANTGIIGQALRSGLATFANSQTKPFLTTRIAQQNIDRGQQALQFMNNPTNAMTPSGIGTMLGTGFGALAEAETGLKQAGKNIAGGIAKGAEFISQYREAMPELSGVIGQVGGVSGWCGWVQPYVRLIAPVRKNPEGYTYYLGKPANTKKLIGELGDGTFNRANAPRLHIEGATSQELNEIYNILTTGFYK